jgi:hypothetical protein
MVEQKVFNGIMNLDDANDVIPSRHHKYAMNIKFRGNAGNMQAENINGNRLITNSLPSGNNQCIGAIFDDVKNRVYYFNYNSTGRNGIYYYDTLLKTISPVLVSYRNSTTDIFNFNPQYPIPSINILYKDVIDGDVLYWTDRLNRPQYLNVKEAIDSFQSGGIYTNGTNWLAQYLTVAKQMPLIPPICSYNNNPDVLINNLKNALYEIRYRWVYRDNSKSTWSPWSKLFTPKDIDSLATEINPIYNNEIQAIIYTGPADCIKIEVGARRSLTNTFGNAILIDTLDKAAIPLADNTSYTYKFYNDSAYDYVDQAESILLYDYVPKKANAQELINGNLLIYGGLTEGNNPEVTINATVDNFLVTNNANNTPIAISLSDEQSSPVTGVYTGSYNINFSGTPIVGDIVYLNITIYNKTAGSYTNTFSYTATTVNLVDLITGLANAINADTTFISDGIAASSSSTFISLYGTITDPITGGNTSRTDSVNPTITYINPPGPTPSDVSSAIYKHNSRYTFGIVYFDEFGVTNGVMTTTNLKVKTKEIETITPLVLNTNQLTIPRIKVSINNQPPSWAKYFSFVRTNNLTVNTLKSIISDGTWREGSGTYGYLDITSYNTNTSGYPTYPKVINGDRVRVIGVSGSAVSSIADYPILGIINDKPVGSGFPTTGFFLKLQYDASRMSGWQTTAKYYIEIYTPALSTDADLLSFYEFGETYPVLNPGLSNRYHKGQEQDQTSSLPAIYNFFRGDFYSRKRDDKWIIDQSVSDKFPSEIVGNGRPFVIDPFAKEAYNPTLVRYGGSYQQGTLINAINRFYFPNFEEYDRQKGDIQRLKLKEKVLRIFQSRGTGVVNVYATEMTNQDGTTNLIGSTNILNPINYYAGAYGIGNQYCSLTSSSSADYYVDPINGYHMRLGRDGNTPLSELYKGQYFFPSIANKYLDNYTRSEGGYAKILGVYDSFEEEYISIFQTGTKSSVTLTPYTVGFSEKKNAYSSFYSYQPEWIDCANNVLISWKNGGLYLHDSATKDNFYGTQYSSYITLVFNEKNIIKKTFDSITIDANAIWDSATIGDINTSLSQTSNLVASDYELHEGFRHAALMRDSLSLGGIINGDFLKGTWIEVKLNNSATNLVYLSGLYMGYQVSPRNF